MTIPSICGTSLTAFSHYIKERAFRQRSTGTVLLLHSPEYGRRNPRPSPNRDDFISFKGAIPQIVRLRLKIEVLPSEPKRVRIHIVRILLHAESVVVVFPHHCPHFAIMLAITPLLLPFLCVRNNGPLMFSRRSTHFDILLFVSFWKHDTTTLTRSWDQSVISKTFVRFFPLIIEESDLPILSEPAPFWGRLG